MNEDRYIRQSGLIKANLLSAPVTVIGCGAVGSFTALTLAKVGFHHLTVFDGDSVEIHNVPNQFYPLKAVGENKAVALGKMIKMFEGITVKSHNKMWAGSTLNGIVVSAVDSMRARHEIWKSVGRNVAVPVFIDARMGGNQLEVYTVDNKRLEDKKAYIKTLCTDEEASPLPCTERTVIYNVLNVASWIVNQLRLVLSGKEYKRSLIMDLENMMLVVPK